jgi:hypothetical protein
MTAIGGTVALGWRITPPLTPRFSGVNAWQESYPTASAVLEDSTNDKLETAEAVVKTSRPGFTPLKRGVNENRLIFPFVIP